MATHQALKDYWTHEAYSASASFVPELAAKITQWLDPQPSNAILDLGCGDGLLTTKIKSLCSRVAGYDASANLIDAAKKEYGNIDGLTWHVQDCRYLEGSGHAKDGEFDKVFSNAALHWILRDPTKRKSVFIAAYNALRPGGTFVFEMGGAGNVASVHTALLAALVHQGVAISKAREACPWFFPSERLLEQMLQEVGFKVERLELEYRPTKVTDEKEGGLEGWVRLMGAVFLEAVDSKDKAEAMVKEVCDVLQNVLKHGEDGSIWLDYVRLRVLARK